VFVTHHANKSQWLQQSWSDCALAASVQAAAAAWQAQAVVDPVSAVPLVVRTGLIVYRVICQLLCCHCGGFSTGVNLKSFQDSGACHLALLWGCYCKEAESFYQVACSIVDGVIT
jgi:hypothetical protein